MVVLVDRQSPHRGLVIAAAAAFALLMGLSRIVLGVHYPTDVLVGWITGMSTGWGCISRLYRRAATRVMPPGLPSAKNRPSESFLDGLLPVS